MHRTFVQSLVNSLLLIRQDLLRAGLSESQAGQGLKDLVRDAMAELGLADDLARTARRLWQQFQQEKDSVKRDALYFKLQTLNAALKILAEQTNGDN
jgi:hypothetical protein